MEGRPLESPCSADGALLNIQTGEALAFALGLIRAYRDYTPFSVAKPHDYLNFSGLDDSWLD